MFLVNTGCRSQIPKVKILEVSDVKIIVAGLTIIVNMLAVCSIVIL